MQCLCCNMKINSGRIFKREENGQLFKSCPNCSKTHGVEHIFHPHPRDFGQTPARKSAKNPDGDQSYCSDCRALDKGQPSENIHNGRTCSSL